MLPAQNCDNESWRAVMALKIYNTLTREKEPFEPVVPGHVNMYVCGPTVYDSPHIGHAKASISFDIVVRYLRYRGYDVRYVQNITDVGHLTDDNDEGEDKILKRAEPGHIMQWNSPWGPGFPGWHIECSAMAMKYLGETLDIHGAGVDNIFPHNEDEIAQSECATHKPFVRYWMHNGSLMINGVKMSKSLGNFLTVEDAIERYGSARLRYFLISSHYRSRQDFSPEAIESAGRGLEGLQIAIQHADRYLAMAN